MCKIVSFEDICDTRLTQGGGFGHIKGAGVEHLKVRKDGFSFSRPYSVM